MTAVDIDSHDPQQRRPRRRPPPPAGPRVVAAPLHRLVAGSSGRSRSRTTTSTSARPSTSARRGGPTSATSRCPTTAGASSWPTRSPIAASASATTGATPAWQEVPGEYRADLRRLVVVQGDTEPASVEQQRALCLTAPSLYDLRNLFQVNVEEGRHLWAMVYLLHRYFGRDGRDEADEMLERHSGDEDNPRDPGGVQRADARIGCRSSSSRTSPTATGSSSSPRCGRAASTRCRAPATSCSRRRRTTCSWAPPGVGRVVQRTVELMKEHDTDDVAAPRRDRRGHAAALPQPPLQRVARPVRRRDLDQRRQLLRRRAQGPVPGGGPRRRPPAASTPRRAVPVRGRRAPRRAGGAGAGRAQRDASRRLRRRLPEGPRPLEPDAGGRRAASWCCPTSGSTGGSASSPRTG